MVAVKRFPENTYFPEMLISGKGKFFSVFGCISKIFPKIFSGVWKRRRKTQTQEKYHQRSRDRADLAINSASSRRRDLTIDLRLRSRDGAISRRQSRSEARARDHDLATARDCDLREIAPPGARTGDRCRLKLGLEIGAAWRSTDCSVSSPLSRARALSLSLFLFPEML